MPSLPLGGALALSAVLATAVAAAPQQRARALTPVHGAETRAEIELPELGLTVQDVRRVRPDGSVERIGLDASGAAVDVDLLRRRDHDLGHERRGKLSPELFERLRATAADELVEVVFWLVEPDDGAELERDLFEAVRDVPEEDVADVVHALRPELLARNTARLATRVTAMRADVLAAGGEVVTEGLGWPIVIAKVRKDRIAGLAASERVDEVYYSWPVWLEEGQFPQATLRTYNVHDQGILADGSVRVLINDTAQVYTGSDWLPPVIELNTDAPATHATGVAGNIANTHPQFYASSYTLPEIYTAGGSGDSIAPGNWALGLAAGIDFGNTSWWNGSKGSIVFLDRFFDYTVRHFSVMHFKSNGNQGGTSTPYSTTPGNGYNMTSSGNFDDGSSAAWADDTMVSSSSYWNPSEGHEKPEVASPGNCVTTTTTSPSGLQTCFGGTSSASPLTAGVATLFTSFDNSLLARMPAVKAILMASAWHNVEGAALLSDKDGAGGVHATAATSVVVDGQWWYDQVLEADFVGDVLDVPIPLLNGDETRVVALWFSNPDSAYATDVLQMDLDLVVLDPTGNPVASSASALNPFEIASFVPQANGDYTVRLTKQRFDGAREPLAIAWSTRSDAGVAQVEVSSTPPFAPGETPLLTVRERYEGAGRIYVLAAALGGPQGIPLGGGYAFPVALDALALASFELPGFVGLLDANGEATVSFPLPSAAPVGVDLDFGVTVFSGSLISGLDVAAVSPAVRLTIQP